jgi:hypothetical protein
MALATHKNLCGYHVTVSHGERILVLRRITGLVFWIVKSQHLQQESFDIRSTRCEFKSGAWTKDGKVRWGRAPGFMDITLKEDILLRQIKKTATIR